MLLRQKHHTHAVFARRRQGNALRRHFFAVQRIGQLDQDARAVAHQFVSAHSAPVVQIFKDLQALLDDGMRLVPLDMGYKAHAARVVLTRPGVQAMLFGMLDLGSSGHRNLLGRAHRILRRNKIAKHFNGGQIPIVLLLFQFLFNWGQIPIETKSQAASID